MKVNTISVIGLQRTGCSIALAIKKKLPDLTILGYDWDRDFVRQAKEIGAIDKSSLSMVNVAADGDIVILAAGFNESKKTIKAIGSHLQSHAVLLDLSPLKRPVQKWVDEFVTNGHYVPIYPIMNVGLMTDMRIGPEAANPDLFRDSVICLMPSPKVDEAAVQTAEQIGKILGAESFYVDIDEFDIYIQALETVPSLLSSALFQALNSTTGWQDMQRMAGQTFAIATNQFASAEDLAAMAFQDKGSTLHWIDATVDYLQEMRRWVQSGDRETLAALLTEMSIQRDQWLRDRLENNWHEGTAPRFENPGIMQQLFGSFGARRFGRDDDK